MSELKTDLLVIGAGSGGLSVAAGAAQMGADVILLEGNRMGGDCLNFGCVPSKALIAAGKAAHAQANAAIFGISDVTPKVDYPATMQHVQDVIAQIAPHDSQERFESLGVRVIREHGSFVSPRQVQAGAHLITARRVVIATGSSPLVPPIPGLDSVPYETNETLFEKREQPGHLLIVGGGPIGMEMAQAQRRLGAGVTVIEGAKALGRDDPETAAVLLDALRDEGIEIAEDALASEIRGKPGAIEIETSDGRLLKGTHLLIAAGRKPNVERLNLPAAGIETTKAGIKVDAALKTTNARVYAIGDVAGGLQFTHVAGYHAGIVIRSALFGLPAKAGTTHIPWVTYTAPELAQVGLTEDEAKRAHGEKLELVRFPYAQNDRAIAERKPQGLIKVMVVSGRPVGVSIVGAQAGELIGLWAFAMANRLKMKHVAKMVAPYPTLGELNKRAAGAYFSPKLFDNPKVKKIVGLVQRWIP
ncbi:FAD-dependent oxidoreductase [Roseovarius sp. EGI FJ00037]|uniref:dihydrolipoyl dehydrogenase family protein n=1 Tax=Roseovarius TaxID=74030 RepID=UPI0022A7BF83|nr:FAD-dependent oxidoreductase [Roseovarius sp. EGI FJ00037]MCZ0810898.1 FAD-dependent oxidoreductase [Roseovarius sp. EGI FJ00037]